MEFFSEDQRVYIDPTDEMEKYLANLKQISRFPLPKKLIYTPIVLKSLQKKIKGEIKYILPKIYPNKPLYWLKNDILYYEGLIGAPATIIFLEELIALGVTEIIFIGLAGGISNSQIGKNYFITEAIRKEGTSYHYFSNNIPSKPSSKLLKLFERYCYSKGKKIDKCSVCSIDAPFRETFKLVNYLRNHLVTAIEMEISAVYSLAKYRNINALALITISDLLVNDKWSHFKPELFVKNFLDLFDISKEFLSTLK